VALRQSALCLTTQKSQFHLAIGIAVRHRFTVGSLPAVLWATSGPISMMAHLGIRKRSGSLHAASRIDQGPAAERPPSQEKIRVFNQHIKKVSR
jgi:hypothetical protein